MSKGTAFQNDNLKLYLHGVAIDDIAANDGSSPALEYYLSLHTGSPAGAVQNTNECAYTGYARVPVARDSSGWTIVGNVANLTSQVLFGICSAGSETALYFGFGTAASGAGKLMYHGPLSPTIPIIVATEPKLGTDTKITED